MRNFICNEVPCLFWVCQEGGRVVEQGKRETRRPDFQKSEKRSNSNLSALGQMASKAASKHTDHYKQHWAGGIW